MSDAGRDSFARYRDRLRSLGFRPSSARGQNFLLDASLHRWIAGAAAPTARDLVLEIGVGLGFLTRELAALAGRVLGVEIDPRLHAVASADLGDLQNVELILADALGGAGGTIDPAITAAVDRARGQDAGFFVVANLPYSVSGPLLAELLCLPMPPDRIVVLVQRELGERLGARPGTKAFGGLSAQLQATYSVELLRTVSAEVFRPRPKVASVVVRLDRRTEPALADAAARRGFQAFVRVLFGQRRKTLRSTLPAAAAAVGGAMALDLPPALLAQRAETLPADDLVAIWRRVAPPRAAPQGPPRS